MKYTMFFNNFEFLYYIFKLLHQQSRDGRIESRKAIYDEQYRLFKINWENKRKNIVNLRIMLLEF